MKTRLIIIATLIFALIVSAYLILNGSENRSDREGMSAGEALSDGDTEGFERAIEKRDFVFPEDFGPHDRYQTEWWYYTGNLVDDSGRRFGYQLTFFRRALMPEMPERESKWASRQIYFAHFALSDISGEEFHAYERWSRGTLGLAGARVMPFRVWIGDWSVGKEDGAFVIKAKDENIAIDLNLTSAKPIVLQGNEGLSQKSDEPGNASYYFSQTRLETTGTVSLKGNDFRVRGLSWLDREWSTSALGKNQEGWDWFSLQLDDGREIMLYQLRLKGGGVDSHSSGRLIRKDGSTIHLDAGDFSIEVLDRWESPHTGIVYPSRWRVSIPDYGISLGVAPYLSDQELVLSFVYWEGAVRVSGDGVSGSGYVELTGYETGNERNK
jgi:predicted secreted hydrolase